MPLTCLIGSRQVLLGGQSVGLTQQKRIVHGVQLAVVCREGLLLSSEAVGKHGAGLAQLANS
jgi:hypothetical protein